MAVATMPKALIQVTMRIDPERYAEMAREVARRKEAGESRASINDWLVEAVTEKLARGQERQAHGGGDG